MVQVVGRSASKLVRRGAVSTITVAVITSTAFAHSGTDVIRVAIMTDCRGSLGFAYESSLGGAQAALAQYAGAKVVDPKRPSAGLTGAAVAGRPVKILYGCGDGTVGQAVTETKRLMEDLNADVMIGPASGDEAAAIAQYAEQHPTKTFIVGTGSSQDPTLQIAPKNVFRYHGDDVQRNAGLGELVYRRLGWRKAAMVVDDSSLGWTSAAGMVADFCAVGGQIVRRVFVPPHTTDYSSYIRQLPPPDRIDGYFWAVGGEAMTQALTAFAQRYGVPDPKRHAVDMPFGSDGDFDRFARQLVGAYVGGFGTAPGLRTKQAKAYEAIIARWYPGLRGGNQADRFVYDYFNATWAFVRGLRAAAGDISKLAANLPPTSRSGYEVSDAGLVRLDENRQAIQDEYPLQIVKGRHGQPTAVVVAQVPNVDQSFGGLFAKTSPPPGRTQPACSKRKLPWQGKITAVKSGVVTKQPIG